MSYILRTTNGIVLSENLKEKIFQSKEEAETYMSLIQFSTTEEWKLIPLDGKE